MINHWLKSALGRARRLYQDSDRKAFAAREFEKLVLRVHALATASAIQCDSEPRVERYQLDEQSPTLELVWHDEVSGWSLAFRVKRAAQVKPYPELDFYGDASAGSYSIGRPDDRDIQKSLHDYFEAWKKSGAGPSKRLRAPKER